MHMVFSPVALIAELIVLAFVLLPVILGFTVIRVDANRHGQPGWLWALLTIPLNWLAVLAYLVVRALTGGGSPQV